MADLETLQQRLEEAELAHHRLLTGTLEVTISVGGYGATTYDRSDIDKLATYIAQLKRDIAKLQCRPRRGPLFAKF